MLTRADLERAVAQGIITAPQMQAICQMAAKRPSDPGAARFDLTHVLYYLGGMIAIGALSLFMTLAWEKVGAAGLLATAALYGIAAYALAVALEKRSLALPAGIMATIVVVVTPLAIYALQHLLGAWPGDGPRASSYRDYHYHVDWRWILMELATLAMGAAMLWRFRYAFLVMPVAVTLWYMSLDLAPLLATAADQGSPAVAQLRKWVSIGMGVATLGLALLVDMRNRSQPDFAFWLYLFGLASFWGGISLLGSQGLAGKLAYLAINLALILVGAMILRRAFAVFGGLGVAFVLADISRTFFKDSFAFTIVLTLSGLAIVGAGILWQRHEARISRSLRGLLPTGWRQMVEARA